MLERKANSIAEFHSLVRDGYYLAEAYKVRSDRFDEYRLEMASAGDIPISRYHGTKVGVRRTWQHIREQASGVYVMWFPLDGPIAISQDTFHDTVISPGQFAITCADRPFHARSQPLDGEHSAMMHVLIPSQMIRSRIPLIDRHCGKAFAGNCSATAIARDIFLGLLDEGQGVHPEDAITLSTSALQCTVAQISRETAGDYNLARSNPHFTRLRSFVERHLSDQGLTVDGVAAGCSISKRYVHYLMKEQGTTFGKYLWERRLLQCRTWIRDPEFAHFNLIDIAYMCGFKTGSHFSTAYKEFFGITPSEERATVRK